MMMNSRLLLITLLLFLPVGVAKADQAKHTTITLTPEGCAEYAELLTKKVHKVEVNEGSFSDDVRAVVDYVIENNSDLERIPAPILYSEALGGCYAAKGQTIVPPRTRL